MKVKELLKTVNVAWSPPAQYPILLATGTAAQQLDASFNTSASLDLYSLNLQQPGYEMELKASIASDHRFHKIIWGSHGNNPAGTIVGGCDYGTIKIYSASKLLANDRNCLISSPDRHTGPVRALDFNPFQANLLATGATESEIYIWDIVNTSTPMTPGTRSQPLEDVQYIAWNKQVQHILASTFSQRCVIWDLRKNEPIIKLTDANSKVRWKVVQWHPDVATQLCLASEDDQFPVIELWDLRFATSPLKTLQSHQRGVLSIAWNPCDPDLLLSCAKDNRILCWNPNSDAPNGEVLCELAQTSQWNFDVSWCPRNPGLIVGSSFDGHAVVYSLLGGQNQATGETSSKIVDSFPGMDPFTQPHPVAPTETVAVLSKAPKWLKRPFGASFGFGGRLVIFENEPADPNLPANSNKKVIISQVVTQPDLIKRSNDLEATLKSEQYSEYCKGKIESATDDHAKKIWSCVAAYFGENASKDILELLGYNVEAINEKLNQSLPQDDVNSITEGIGNINTALNGNILDGSAAFDAIAQEQCKKVSTPLKSTKTNININMSDDDDGLITQAILLGNIEAAVSLCFESKRYADAVILSMAGGPDLLARTQYRYFSEHTSALNSLINSLVSENWAEIVKNSDVKCWKEVLVGVFTHSNIQERSVLCDMLGDRLAVCDNPSLKKQAEICYICSGNLNKLIEICDVDIQEVVELVTIMQKALELQGIKEIQIEGNIASILSRYAEMLAAEGNLEAALNYLGNSQEERISMLRDRLCRALGYIQDPPRNIAKGMAQTQNYYEQPRRSLHNLPNTNVSSQLSNSPQMWNVAPTKQSFNAPISSQFNTQRSQSFGVPPVQPMPSQVPPLYANDQYSTSQSYGQPSMTQAPPPPPPTSSANPSGSRPSSVGPQSRSKYLIDPSVKSSSSYSSYGQSAFQPQTFNSPVAPVPSYPVHNSYQPQIPTYPAQNFGTLKEPEPFKPPQPNLLPSNQGLSQPDVYNPREQPISQTSNYGNESYQPGPQPSGWNDPPIAKASRVQPKPDYQPQTPILHPLHGAQPDTNTLSQDFYQDNQAYNQQQYGKNISSLGAQYNKPVQSMQHMQSMQPMQPMQSMQTMQPVQSMQHVQSTEALQPAAAVRAPEPEKPKAPIPEEHIHLKTVFDELKVQCYETAKNPQIKRKLEDVSRKLEVLYDCLRENKLSQNTLQGLHQISQLVQSGNYTDGLHLHTELASGPDFSQISAFMTGIKVLLQSALQLGVYIR